MALIYVVEDDKNIQEIETFALANVGYEVKGFDSATDFYAALNETAPDLILLDIMLPDEDGLSIVKKLRTRQDTVLVPVIMVTAKTTEIDKVKGLDLGADDYITKPFNPVEVLARVKSQLRRFLQLGAAVKAPSELTVGGIALDHDAKRVTLDGEEIALTPKEYDILYYLMQHPGKVFTPAELYSAVWNEAPVGIDNTVAVDIRHLREKLEINPSEPRYLKVVWGKGYKLEGDRP